MGDPRIVLRRDDEELPVTLAEDGGAPSVDCPCPACGERLFVVGSGRTIGGFDYYRADGFCVRCKARVGEIRAYVSTIFGIEEDERVLYGRPRVY